MLVSLPTVDRVRRDGDQQTVDVSLKQLYKDPLTYSFTFARLGGTWKIVRDTLLGGGVEEP